jgi:uncharacterized membrane protein HdeD (DUF308 family)
MKSNQPEFVGGLSAGIKSSGRKMTVLGIITIILGLAAIAAPAITGLSVVLAVGLMVIAGGIMRMIWAFGAESFGRGLMAFALGGLMLLCGLSMVTDPLIASGFLTVLIAICLTADGIAEITGAFSVSSGRGWMILGGIASILLGVMIWRQFPLSGIWAVGVLLGIRLLFSGLVILTVGSAGRGLARRMDAAT